MIGKKVILAGALSAALALPTPGLAKPAPTNNNGALVLLVVGAVVAGILFSGVLPGGATTFSTKDAKTNPFNGVTKGPVIMGF